jgi:phage terminase small subunit
MSGKESKLTNKQAAFVNEYLIDLNATQAAIRAGYSVKTATEQGSRLLTNVNVSEAIADGQAQKAEKSSRTALDVLKDIQMDTRSARQQGDLKTSLKGLELEGKHLGMFVERRELSGPGGGAIAVRGLDAFYADQTKTEDGE